MNDDKTARNDMTSPSVGDEQQLRETEASIRKSQETLYFMTMSDMNSEGRASLSLNVPNLGPVVLDESRDPSERRWPIDPKTGLRQPLARTEAEYWQNAAEEHNKRFVPIGVFREAWMAGGRWSHPGAAFVMGPEEAEAFDAWLAEQGLTK